MKISWLLYLILFASFSAKSQQLYFPPITGNTWDTISPQNLGYCQPKIDSLYSFLEQNNSKAFILLKDGKIVLEKYFGTHTVTTPWQWASAGKTITSFMTGIAQQEGYLSITDTTASYLGQGWTNCTPQEEEKITLWHQLTMTSGLNDGVQDPYCTLDTCLEYLADAGSRWAYHNGPYTLLDDVIQNATGQSLNNYTTIKLKTPTGMNGTFLGVGYNNVFFSNARSMARFGLLIMNKGNWNGNQIMTDTNYFNEMVNTSQSLNKAYGYLWWLNGKGSYMVPTLQNVFPGWFCPHAPEDMISAIGAGGQFLNVIPSQGMVWLRMGDDPGNSLVPFLLNDAIWQYVNDLECTIGIAEVMASEQLEVYPNPIVDELIITKISKEMGNFLLIDSYGRILQTILPEAETLNINFSNYQSGLYHLIATNSNFCVKIVKD